MYEVKLQFYVSYIAIALLQKPLMISATPHHAEATRTAESVEIDQYAHAFLATMAIP